MPSKKYNNGRRREKTGGDNEIFGIVLVIISAFILLCITIPIVLFSLGYAVRNVITGIFGSFAYPLFLCTLIWGIALIKGRSADLSARYKVGIVCMAVSLMLLLQLATSHSALNAKFSDYISTVYHKGAKTAGGVLFGIFAYGIQAAITEVVSYIFYSLAFIGSLGFFILLPIYAKRRNEKEAAMPAEQGNAFVKGAGMTKSVKAVNDNTLFVDTIRPLQADRTPRNETPVMGFGESEPVPQPPAPPKYAPPQEPQFQPYSTDKSSASGNYKSKAHEILFGNRSTYLNGPTSSTNYTAQTYSDSGISLPPIVTGDPVVKNTAPAQPPVPSPEQPKPKKKVHVTDIPGLHEIPVLPGKDISDQIVEGPAIINGDDLSRTLAENMALSGKETDAPKPDIFTRKTITPTPILPKQPAAEEPERPAIINGDLYGSPKQSGTAASARPAVVAAPKTAESSYQIDPSNYDTDFRSFESPKTQEQEEEKQNPIVTGSDYEKSKDPEESFLQLLNKERERNKPASKPSEEKLSVSPDPFDDWSFGGSFGQSADSLESQDKSAHFTLSVPDPIKAEEDSTLIVDEFAPKPADTGIKFNVIEEAEDLSESSHFGDSDHTGYYDTASVTGTRAEIDKPEPPAQPKEPPQEKPRQGTIEDITANAPLPPKPKKKKRAKYNPPDIDMLIPSEAITLENYNAACEEKARLLEETLQELKLPVKVTGITRGPAVTRYELEMPPGIPIKRIEQFSTDIEYYLASNGKIRIEAPIPGKRAVGIEVPNDEIDIVRLRDIIESKEFHASSSPLTLALGKDIAGTNMICNLEKMPHLLIAGATGSGKSACLNSIIISILYKSSPEDVRLILIDPKRVEFNLYENIPHLLGANIINDAQQAINALTWAKEEMDRRYILFGHHRVRNLSEFNKSDVVKSGEEQKLPYIVLIVDELAELMLDNNKKLLEGKIMSMAQKARAAGIHLILATQRPSVDVITGTIKANLPSRIAFSVKSIVDSRTILDECGAETLLGRGDMLYAPMGMDVPRRVQGAFVTDNEVKCVAEYVRVNNEADFDEEFTTAITKRNDEPEAEDDKGDDSKEFDSLMPEVLKCVIESGTASTSMIQRRFSVGYARASRIIDQMELHKFIGPMDGTKPRAVYITREQYKELFGIDL